MAQNIYSLQLLRNGTPYETREAAYAALQSASGLTNTNNRDGVPVLARYLDGEQGSEVVKTLLGLYAYNVAGGADYMTIIDVDGAYADVDELRTEIMNILGNGVSSGTGETVTEQLTALSGDSSTSQSGDTSVEGAKKYADEKIDEALDGLDASSVSGASKVVIDVTQEDGQITATAENLTGVKLDGLTAGTDTKIAATDTLGEALANLQGQIDAMDLTAVGSTDGVITVVSETDGKVAATATPITSISLSGFTADTSVMTPLSATDTVNIALNKLQNSIAASQSATTVASSAGTINVTLSTGGTNIDVHVKDGEKVLAIDANGDGVYTDIKLSSVTPSSEVVKEEYSLIATDGSVLGENIKIYKDSHIKSITYISDPADAHYQNLEYQYITDSGTTSTTYVDMSELVIEAEFASGVTVTNHVAHGVVDPTSETFLTVGADGFKLSGVQDAIDDAFEALDASVTGGTTAGTATSDHVQVVVDEVDGKLTDVTVTETNIADKSALDALSAKTVTEITSANSSLTVTSTAATDGTVTVDLVTDASKIKMSGFTAETGGFTGITESDSITDAFKEVETQILANERVTAAALNDLDTRLQAIETGTTGQLDEEIAARKAVDGISAQTYQATSAANYISGATSLNDADQKLDAAVKGVADDLDAEIAARKAVDGQTGQTYAANTAATYISGATDLNDADVKLDAALKNVDDNMIIGATMNGSAVTETNKVLEFTAQASTAHTVSDNAIVIDTNANGGLTFSLGTIDAGTY